MLNANTSKRRNRFGAHTLAAALLLAVASVLIPPAAAQGPTPDKIATDNGGQLIIMDADGGNKQTVNTSFYIAFDPSWSPDATKLAFTCRGSEEQNICTVGVAGGAPVRLTDTDQDFEAAYSPDGNQIAFTSMRGGSPRVYLMNADGTNEAPLAIGGFAFTATQQPSWSPDGKKIAFSGDTEDGDTEIYTVEIATGAVVRLTYRAANSPVQPAYSPDGTRVAFSDSRNISTVSADGSNVESNVTTGQDHDHYAPAYSPDGTRLSYYKFEFILDANGERVGERKGVFVSDANGGNLVDTDTPSSVGSAWRPVANDPDPEPEQPTPAERINNLIGVVRGFNLPFGTTNSLTVKLRAALDAVNAGDNATGCARLADFINHANAQSGKKLSAAQAAQLTTEAASIRAAIGCQ